MRMLGVIIGSLGLLAGCTTTAPPSRPVAFQPTPLLAHIRLPDGTDCRHEGTAAVRTFAALPLYYACGFASAGERGLLGPLQIETDTLRALVVRIGYGLDGPELREATPFRFAIAELELPGHIGCRYAGEGGVPSVGGRRVTYRCASLDLGRGEQRVVLGAPRLVGGVLTVQTARLVRTYQGFELADEQDETVQGIRTSRGRAVQRAAPPVQ